MESNELNNYSRSTDFCLNFDQLDITNSKVIADVINFNFCTSNLVKKKPQATLEYKCISKFDLQTVTVSLIKLILKNLDCKKSSGYDGISNKLLKYCYQELCGPLCHVINSSIGQSRFPDIWKLAQVLPISKNNDQTISSFRPISVLPALS